MFKATKTEQVTFEFLTAEAGWLDFKLTVGDQTYSDCFFELFDPIQRLKSWLEDISTGVHQTSFQYDNAGEVIKFDLEKANNYGDVFTVSEVSEKNPIFIKALIDRKQLVRAFYQGVLSFSVSEKYDPKQWESKTIKEYICKIINIDEETLLQRLLNLNSKEFEDFLIITDTLYYFDLPEEQEDFDEYKLLLQRTLNQEKIVIENGGIREEFEIPDEYNGWTVDKKKEFILEEISYYIECNNGTPLRDLQSEIIEKYLAEE